MRFSRAAVYAIHSLVLLIGEGGKGRTTSRKLAEIADMPERFLLQILKRLVSAQVLASNRGASGGYSLRKEASDVNLLDIVEAIDGPFVSQHDIQTPGLESLENELIDMQDNITNDIADQLKAISIADLAAKVMANGQQIPQNETQQTSSPNIPNMHTGHTNVNQPSMPYIPTNPNNMGMGSQYHSNG